MRDERPGSVLSDTGALGLWAETAAPQASNLVLYSTQATPNKMAPPFSPSHWEGVLEAEGHRPAGELKEEHYLPLYPAET